MNATQTSPTSPPIRRRGRPRPEIGLIVGSAIVIVVVMLLWTAVIPSSEYPPNLSRLTFEVPSCTDAGEALPHVWESFPLWATVHVRWTAAGGVVIFEIESGLYIPVFQGGTQGNGSFLSNAQTFAIWAFDPLPPNGTACPHMLVVATLSYSV